MITRSTFAKQVVAIADTQLDQAIAFLWYYRQTQEYEERTASDLATDLHDEGFSKPNASRLHRALARSRQTIKGRRPKTFQVNIRKLEKLNEKYGHLLGLKQVDVSDAVIPNEWVAGTRLYLIKIVHQINGSYDSGFYDCCAAMCRRLLESLLIETYIVQKRTHEIQKGGVFVMLDQLIKYAKSDSNLTLSRNTPKTMEEVKQLGDTAAHDRTYVTDQSDIDILRAKFRRVIQELLSLTGIR